MALPADYRIVVVNNVGESVAASAVTVDLLPFSGDGSGGVSHGTEQTGSNSSSIAAGSSAVIVTVNTSTAVGFNGNVVGDLSGGTGPSGDLEFFIERSTDGGTEWNRDPTPLAVLSYSSATSKDTAIAA